MAVNDHAVWAANISRYCQPLQSGKFLQTIIVLGKHITAF